MGFGGFPLLLPQAGQAGRSAQFPGFRLLAASHLEACARRTGFVRRTSKLTGKVFVALVTSRAWSTRKTSLGQLVAKAAQ